MFVSRSIRTRPAKLFLALTVALVVSGPGFSQDDRSAAEKQADALGLHSKGIRSAPAIKPTPDSGGGEGDGVMASVRTLGELQPLPDKRAYLRLTGIVRNIREKSDLVWRRKLSLDGFTSTNLSELEQLDDQLYATLAVADLEKDFDDRVRSTAALPFGSAAYVESLRRLGISGYYFGWRLVTEHRLDDAQRVRAQIKTALGTYFETPPPALAIVVARYQWMSRYYFITVADKPATEDAEAKIRKLIATAAPYPEDYPLMSRMKARVLLNAPGNLEKSPNAAACDLYDTLVLIRPANGTIEAEWTNCRIAEADAQLAAKNQDVAVALIDTALERFRSIERVGDTKTIELQLNEVVLLNALARMERNPPYTVDPNNYKLAAAQRFAAMFAGNVYSPAYPAEVQNAYSAFSDFEETGLAPPAAADGARPGKADLFAQIASAIDRSRKELPDSRGYAYVALDARTKAATALMTDDRNADALVQSDAAMAVLRETPIIASLTSYAEDGLVECSMLRQRIDLQLMLGMDQDAEQTFSVMDAGCGQWSKKYPWDFYARSPFVSASSAIGRMFHARKRFADAVPMLTYASNWGDDWASFYLADMYRTGHGVKADAARARSLYELAGFQSMKRFTVPTDFNGVKYPFNVYVMHYARVPRCPLQEKAIDPATVCAGFSGIDDQALWLRVARGGEMPKDVIESFQKLDKIATENNVSLPELAVYALGATNPSPGKKSDPVGPGPVTDAVPTVTGTALYAVDQRSSAPHEVEALVIPFIPDHVCVRWKINVSPDHRRVPLRQVLNFPTAPANIWAPENSSVAQDGRQWTTSWIASLDEGLITGDICLKKGMPLGQYRLKILVGKKSLYSISFEAVADDGLFEWDGTKK